MMEAISLLDDLDNAWALIIAYAEAKDKERGKDKMAEAGNIIQINLVLGRQAKLLVKLRKHIKHEAI